MSENSRVVKNTLFLYVRMALVMFVSLFTSRIILKSLGTVDYGLYNVVGGIVVMLSFLNNTAAGATSRFLTFALGAKDKEKYDYRKIFSTAFFIHVLIALIIVIVCETCGLWYVMNKMVIPDERRTAAIWVYQFSIASCLVSFTQVPYNASIIANEKMDIYAFVGIFEVAAKLLISIFIVHTGFDRLVFYAFLIFLLTTSIAFFYRIYCIRTFGENCRLEIVREKRIYKMLLSYSGWDLIGNFGGVARSQGVNLILNLFCGPVVNAARAVTFQVESALNSFTTNFQTAIRPVIIKKYAAGEVDAMLKLFYLTCKFSCILYSLLAIPILFEADAILKLWLVTPPEDTALFLKIVLITYFFSSINSSIGISVHATGDVKRLNIFAGSKIFVELPLIYILLKNGCPAYSSLIVMAASSFLIMYVDVLILKLNIKKVKFRTFFTDVQLRLISSLALPILGSWLVHKFLLCNVFLKIITVCFAYWIILVPCVFFICLNKSEREIAGNYIKKILGKFKKNKAVE